MIAGHPCILDACINLAWRSHNHNQYMHAALRADLRTRTGAPHQGPGAARRLTVASVVVCSDSGIVSVVVSPVVAGLALGGLCDG
jgi:hypothetical protein